MARTIKLFCQLFSISFSLSQGWTQTLDFVMARQVFYHCATAARLILYYDKQCFLLYIEFITEDTKAIHTNIATN